MKRLLPLTIALAGIFLGWGIMQLAQAAPISIPTAGYQVTPERTATLQIGWRYARNEATTGYVTAEDVVATNATAIWQNTGTYFTIPPEWNYVSIAFLCYGDGDGAGSPAPGTFDVNIYVAEPYSSWDHVCEFSAAVGTLQTSHNPVTGAELNSGAVSTDYCWAEGLFTSATNYAWLSTPQYTGCSNGIGRCTFDAFGGRVLIIQISNIANLTRIYPLVKGR